MTTNLHCGAEFDPALKLVSGAKLDMNGYNLRCTGGESNSQTGVLINGLGSELMNSSSAGGGHIVGCDVAVDISGILRDDGQLLGKHTVWGITAHDSISNGFVVNSNVNHLTHNVANGATNGNGFDVLGSFNVLSENQANDNSDRGFDLEEGVQGNLLVKNVATANGDDGFKIRGSGNVIIYNKAIRNTKEGFVAESQNSTFYANTARRNTDNGLKTDGGQGNQLIRNKATRNGANGISIDNDSSDNKLVFNRAFRNQQSGIVAAAGSSDNTISRSTAFRNSRSDVMSFDLLDENGDCDHNTWKGNAAGSADPSCTRGE
jgi:parallel beta-helix repeat protein